MPSERSTDMPQKRFKPKYDKIFWWTWIPTVVLLIAATVIAAFEPVALCIMIPTDIFTLYFLVTTLVGYAELRERSVFIRFGFILKIEIPYAKIRGVTKERKFYADSMVAIKCSMEHLNIKYNLFDVATISVRDNDEFLSELTARIEKERQNN